MATNWLDYAAPAVTLIVWGGLFIAIFKLDRRVKRLERE